MFYQENVVVDSVNAYISCVLWNFRLLLIFLWFLLTYVADTVVYTVQLKMAITRIFTDLTESSSMFLTRHIYDSSFPSFINKVWLPSFSLGLCVICSECLTQESVFQRSSSPRGAPPSHMHEQWATVQFTVRTVCTTVYYTYSCLCPQNHTAV